VEKTRLNLRLLVSVLIFCLLSCHALPAQTQIRRLTVSTHQCKRRTAKQLRRWRFTKRNEHLPSVPWAEPQTAAEDKLPMSIFGKRWAFFHVCDLVISHSPLL